MCVLEGNAGGYRKQSSGREIDGEHGAAHAGRSIDIDASSWWSDTTVRGVLGRESF